MDPTAVGQTGTRLVLGKHSGRAAFGDALARLGLVLEDEDFQRAFDRFKELADRKGEIGEEGLLAIVQDTADRSDVIHFGGWYASGGSAREPSASVQVVRNGEKETYEGSGDGMVHAVFAALCKAFDTQAALIDYRVNPITSGADAMAEVNVVVKQADRVYSGRGTSTDIVEGSARAFLVALTKAGRTSTGSAIA
jgi:2-isopropylmalate synthase